MTSPNNEDKKSPEWVNSFRDMMQTAQSEFKRATQIGMKMISASQSTSNLHECYEELGVLVRTALSEKELEWDNDQAKKLIERIETLEKELEGYEDEVQRIKKE